MWPLLVPVAAALAMHVFVTQVAGSRYGALLAAVIWGSAASYFADPGHLQFQALCFFLPLTFLCLHRLIAARRTRDALALGVLAGLQVITAVEYAAVGGLGLVIAGVVLAAASSRRGAGRVASRMVFAAAVAAIVAVPVVGSAALTGTNVLPPRDPDGALFYGLVLLAPALAGVWFGWRSDARPLVAAMSAVSIVGSVLAGGYPQATQVPAGFVVLVMLALTTLTALALREVSSDAHRARIKNAVTMEPDHYVR